MPQNKMAQLGGGGGAHALSQVRSQQPWGSLAECSLLCPVSNPCNTLRDACPSSCLTDERTGVQMVKFPSRSVAQPASQVFLSTEPHTHLYLLTSGRPRLAIDPATKCIVVREGQQVTVSVCMLSDGDPQLYFCLFCMLVSQLHMLWQSLSEHARRLHSEPV